MYKWFEDFVVTTNIKTTNEMISFKRTHRENERIWDICMFSMHTKQTYLFMVATEKQRENTEKAKCNVNFRKRSNLEMKNGITTNSSTVFVFRSETCLCRFFPILSALPLSLSRYEELGVRSIHVVGLTKTLNYVNIRQISSIFIALCLYLFHKDLARYFRNHPCNRS